MRYILNDSGFIETISFNYMVECNNKLCTEYTGTTPSGYESLAEWSENANINAYKIVNGNLVFDSEEDARLQSLWASQGTTTGVTGDTLPIGSMIPYGKATPPTNWLVCDGSAVSRTTYAELFKVIGTSYGAGDGSTTFNLPNKKGKVSVGLDSSDSDFNTIGKTGGSKDMQKHSHRMYITPRNSAETWIEGVQRFVYDSAPTTHANTYLSSILEAGTGTSGNLQPYQVDNWIIKAFQSSGVVGNVLNAESDSETDTYSCDYVNDFVRGKTLYENSSGSNGNITLNDSIFNYKYIEIFFRNNDSVFNSVKVPIIGTTARVVSLTANTVTGGVVYVKTKAISINENRIGIKWENGHVEYRIDTGGCVHLGANNYIYIVKVLGYK